MSRKKHTAPVTICWLRRDLRLSDNRALQMAARSGHPVLCLFIFDRDILDPLPSDDARVGFLHRELDAIRAELEQLGSALLVKHDTVASAWAAICDEFAVKQVVVSRDYEPYARERDEKIYDYLKDRGIEFKGTKDHVIFEKNEVVKADGTPYTVFTPYSRKWKEHYRLHPPADVPDPGPGDFYPCAPLPFPTLSALGFKPSPIAIPPKVLNTALLNTYATRRDLPAVAGTSRLSVHLRFGTVSIRKLYAQAVRHSDKYADELIWREFYQMILYHFPHTTHASFKPAYDRIRWLNDEKQFAAWCAGTTGYPLVDAGMRELNTTGFMHNRVRMVVASFLCKHLLIDWRWGERYFAAKLLDFDLASNAGGWQWAAGSGCDAAPYFRIFNPTAQQERFDPDFAYIKKWVPEFGTPAYPKPIVRHEDARNRCIAVYRQALTE